MFSMIWSPQVLQQSLTVMSGHADASRVKLETGAQEGKDGRSLQASHPNLGPSTIPHLALWSNLGHSGQLCLDAHTKAWCPGAIIIGSPTLVCKTTR